MREAVPQVRQDVVGHVDTEVVDGHTANVSAAPDTVEADSAGRPRYSRASIAAACRSRST
ncbi:hypothetical protein GCM10023068_33850 [Leifsonia shinshuensis]